MTGVQTCALPIYVVYATGICLDELLDELPEYEMKALTEEVEPVHFHMD